MAGFGAIVYKNSKIFIRFLLIFYKKDVIIMLSNLCLEGMGGEKYE
jgi:hypothetical protein